MTQENPNIFDVEGQKKVIEYAAKVQMRQAIKTLLIIFPLILLFVAGILYIVFKFVNVL